MARTRKTAGRARASQRASSNGVTDAEMVAALKKRMLGHSELAKELDVPLSAIPSIRYCRALVAAGQYETVPATSAQAKKLYNNERNRWELIAARMGTTVAHVKQLYADGDGGTPRGPGRPPKEGSKTRGASGKRASVKSGSAKAGSGPRRARTRAERQAARGSNPS